MPDARPNILHILTDQQRFDTISALGNALIRTPNLDRLCREGTAFTHAYTPSPVCVAARCSLLFSQYPATTGCYDNNAMPDDDRQSYVEILSAQGYRTHGIGKCHFTPDPYALRGFQTRERQEEGNHGPEKDEYIRYLHEQGYDYLDKPHGQRDEMYYSPQPSQLPERHHPTSWVGDRSLAFLDEQDGDTPWYLFSSFIAPHPPFNPPEPWYNLYRPAAMPLPRVPEDLELHLDWINRLQNRYKARDRGIDLNLIRCIRAYYYASISFIDYQVGRLLDALEAKGQLDNTLIVFTSDHGEYLGDYHSFGKRNMHDVAARIPLLVRYPSQFPANYRNQTPASLVDLAPTFLAVAGGCFDSHEAEGLNLADLQSGEAEREVVFSQYDRDGLALLMVTSSEWKYFYSVFDQAHFLYHKHSDPQEQVNLAGQAAHENIQREMIQKLQAHLRERGQAHYISGDSWAVFEEHELSSSWTHWNMTTPDKFGDDPDHSLLLSPLKTDRLPEGYRN